jgi:hypothetical protein
MREDLYGRLMAFIDEGFVSQTICRWGRDRLTLENNLEPELHNASKPYVGPRHELHSHL